MDTTMSNDALREEPTMLAPQQRIGPAGVRQPPRKTPGQAAKSVERRLNLHSVHILALEAMIAGLPKQNGIDANRVNAYIDARTAGDNANLGAAAKRVAAELLEAPVEAPLSKPRTSLVDFIKSDTMKRIGSWLIAIAAATALVTAGFVGVAALVMKTGFGG
jgi:hypothetical protein